MGDTATMSSRRATRASRTPGTARSGPIETIGFDGHTTMRSAEASASSHGGGRRAPFGAREADGAHGDVVVQPDEVVLKRHLGAGGPQIGLLGQGQHGADGVVGDREQADVDLAAGRDGGRDLGERVAGPQAFGAEEMGGQVPITEPEPALAAEAGQLLHDRPGLSDHAPAGLPIVHAGQRVGDGVEVGADVEAVENRVVTHVDDGRDGARGNDTDQAGQHAGGSDTAAEGDKHGASIEGATRGARSPGDVSGGLCYAPPPVTPK